jgi:hypothetical protein
MVAHLVSKTRDISQTGSNPVLVARQCSLPVEYSAHNREMEVRFFPLSSKIDDVGVVGFPAGLEIQYD